MAGECFRCGASAVERFGNGWLCEGCIPDRGADLSDDLTETSADDTSVAGS